MRLNARGDYAGGASGGGTEVISINGVVVRNADGTPERGHLGGWFDNNRLCYQHEGPDGIKLAFYDGRTGEISQADSHGSNVLRAGGGVWAAWESGFGLFSSTGQISAQAYLYDVGPDGSIAYKPVYQSGGGLAVNGVDIPGAVVSIDDCQSLGGGNVIWRDGETLHANFTTHLPTLPGQFWRPRARFVNGELWLLYFHVSGLVLHSVNSFNGYRLTPSAFNPDFVAIGDILRVVWATSEGEAPSTIQVKDIALSEPRIDLRGPIVVPPVDPPVDPPKPPDPKPMPNHQDVVVRLAQQFPFDKNDIASIFNFTRRVAHECKGDGCGLLIKPGGENVYTYQGVSYSISRVCYRLHPPSVQGVQIFKILSDAGPGGSNGPQWVDDGQREDMQWHEALAPDDVTTPQPPDPPSTGIDLKPRVVKLETDVASLVSQREDDRRATEQRIFDLKAELLASIVQQIQEAFKHVPPAELPADVVRESTHSVRVPVKLTSVLTGTLVKK